MSAIIRRSVSEGSNAFSIYRQNYGSNSRNFKEMESPSLTPLQGEISNADFSTPHFTQSLQTALDKIEKHREEILNTLEPSTKRTTDFKNPKIIQNAIQLTPHLTGLINSFNVISNAFNFPTIEFENKTQRNRSNSCKNPNAQMQGNSAFESTQIDSIKKIFDSITASRSEIITSLSSSQMIEAKEFEKLHTHLEHVIETINTLIQPYPLAIKKNHPRTKLKSIFSHHKPLPNNLECTFEDDDIALQIWNSVKKEINKELNANLLLDLKNLSSKENFSLLKKLMDKPRRSPLKKGLKEAIKSKDALQIARAEQRILESYRHELLTIIDECLAFDAESIRSISEKEKSIQIQNTKKATMDLTKQILTILEEKITRFIKKKISYHFINLEKKPKEKLPLIQKILNRLAICIRDSYAEGQLEKKILEKNQILIKALTHVKTYDLELKKHQEGLKPNLLPMNGSDSNSFPLEARKNKGAILENMDPLFSEPRVRASREKIISNPTAFIGSKLGLNSTLSTMDELIECWENAILGGYIWIYNEDGKELLRPLKPLSENIDRAQKKLAINEWISKIETVISQHTFGDPKGTLIANFRKYFLKVCSQGIQSLNEDSKEEETSTENSSYILDEHKFIFEKFGSLTKNASPHQFDDPLIEALQKKLSETNPEAMESLSLKDFGYMSNFYRCLYTNFLTETIESIQQANAYLYPDDLTILKAINDWSQDKQCTISITLGKNTTFQWLKKSMLMHQEKDATTPTSLGYLSQNLTITLPSIGSKEEPGEPSLFFFHEKLDDMPPENEWIAKETLRKITMTLRSLAYPNNAFVTPKGVVA